MLLISSRQDILKAARDIFMRLFLKDCPQIDPEDRAENEEPAEKLTKFEKFNMMIGKVNNSNNVFNIEILAHKLHPSRSSNMFKKRVCSF